MELRQLKYFLAALEHGSLAAASESLGVAQSALGRQIAALEQELGVPLLRRGRRGVKGTKAGLQLREMAAGILDQVEAASAAVRSRPRVRGRVMLEMPESVAPMLLQPVMAACRDELPDIELDLRVTDAGDMVRQLQSGKVELAVFTSNVEAARASFEPLVEEDFCLLRAPAMPFAAELQDCTWAQLSAFGVGLMALEAARGRCTRAFVDEHAQRHAWSAPRLVREVNSLAVLACALEAGVAAAVLPRSLFASQLAQGGVVAHRIRPQPPRRTIGIYSCLHRKHAAALVAVGSMLRSLTTRLCLSGAWPGARVLDLPD